MTGKLIEDLVRENEGGMLTHLPTIAEIAKRIAALLIIDTNAFKDFENSEQLSSYLDLAPRIKRSGTSLNGPSIIIKSGNNDMLQMMFMSSLSASTFNKSCQAQFQRILAQAKPKKVALIAAGNKLFKIALVYC